MRKCSRTHALFHIFFFPHGAMGEKRARERERMHACGRREERNKEKESHQKFRTEDDATAARD